MIRPLFVQKLKRLILVRLLAVTVFITLGAFVFEMNPFVYYGVISVFLLLSLIYILWVASERHLKILTYFQIAMDIVAITVFVYYTGGVDSVLATLYVLPILSSGFVLFRRAPVYMAVVSSVFFTAAVIVEHWRVLPDYLPGIAQDFHFERDFFYCFYMVYVRVTIFVLIGFLADYLVRAVDKMEQSLSVREKFALLGEMAMHMAHEIKNPLMAISGSIEVLEDDLRGKLSGENRKLMESIIVESQRLKDLFEKVLDYARPESLDIQRLKLDEVLDEVFILLDAFIKNGKNISVHHEYRGQPPCWIYADRNRIKQVFINIIYNGMQAMPEGGDLSVWMHENNSFCEVNFKDTGLGMNRRERENLFIPFRSGKKGGSGIGLAIAYKIIHNHGGNIAVKSQPGMGSVFTVSLPRLQ